MRESLQQQQQHVADLHQKLDSQKSVIDSQKARIAELTSEARLVQTCLHLLLITESLYRFFLAFVEH